MNIHKWLCEVFDCDKCKDCQQEAEAMQQLMKARCLSQMKFLNSKHKKKINKLNNRINILNQKIGEQDIEIEYLKEAYNAEKAIPKRPDYCQPDDCPFRPNSKKKSKIKVMGKQIFYENDGIIPIKLCGVYRWEAWWRAKNINHNWGNYSLDWYNNQQFKYSTNYVRHGGIKDTQFMYDQCKLMKEHGKIVQITVFRNIDEGILVNLNEMPDLAKLGNVIFDINEFCTNNLADGKADIYKAIEIINQLIDKNCIVVAGSWGSSDYGEQLAEEFHQHYNRHQIEQHHRQWNKQSFKELLSHNKPTIFDEYFAMKNQMSLEETKDLMKLAFDLGYSGVGYYGFRFKGIPGLKDYDPFDYREMLKFTGNLCKELNQ